MLAAFRVIVLFILLLSLWGAALVADHQTRHGNLTVSSILAMALLGAVWLLALLFALLPGH
jgi:hypothetical protein